MPVITKDQAVERISTEITQFACDDLVEVHNELFPDSPESTDGGQVDCDRLLAGITSHIEGGLEVEEIVDLWNVVFPKDRNVWYDEETESIHFNEEPAEVESTD